MIVMKKRGKTVLWVVFLAMGISCLQYAAVKPLYTYYNFTYGARSLSMGNAFTAVGSDLTAAFVNPAAMSELNSPQIFLSCRNSKMDYRYKPEVSTAVTPSQQFEYEWTSTLKNMDFISVAAPVIIWDIKWNFALSYYRYIPYNINGTATSTLSELPGTGTGTQQNRITTLDVSGKNGADVLALTGGFYLTNAMSFGVTVQRFFNSGDKTLKLVSPSTLSTTEFSEKINGWKLIFGLLFKLSKDISLGFSYHTRLNADLDSEYTLKTGPNDLSGTTTTITKSTQATTVLPPQFSGGIMVKPFKLMLLSFDYSVIYWSKSKLSNYYDSTADLQFPVRDDFSFSQKDSVNYRVGMELDIPIKKSVLFLRSGLCRDRQLFVDASNNAVRIKGLSFGVGADFSSKVQIDAAYMRQKGTWKEVGTLNPLGTIDTMYKNNIFILSCTLNFKK